MALKNDLQERSQKRDRKIGNEQEEKKKKYEERNAERLDLQF